MRLLTIAAVSVATGCHAFAQGQVMPTFDVASIKASAPPGPNGEVFIGTPRGGPGTPDPEQITWSGATLMSMVMAAYEVKRYQVAGPDWMLLEDVDQRYRYEVAVKLPSGATKEQIPLMWRNLLKERFNVSAHTESREFPADELTVLKSGTKLKKTTLDPNAPAPAGPPKIGPDGLPQLERPGVSMVARPGPGGPISYLIARAAPIGTLTTFLTNRLGHPVTDKTGLEEKYDFVLEFRPDLTGRSVSPALATPIQGDNAAEPGTDIGTALEQQLGLKLIKSKAPLPFIVIDHVEKTPTEN